jgi:hypothetical protein
MVTVHPPERKGRCKSVVVDMVVDVDVVVTWPLTLTWS